MTRNRQWWFGAFASLPIALLAGCASQSLPAVTSSASRQLSADVDRVAEAARAGNAESIRSALATLRADVAKLKASGGITATRATEVLAAAARVAADTAAATPSPTPTPAPVTTNDKPKDTHEHHKEPPKH